MCPAGCNACAIEVSSGWRGQRASAGQHSTKASLPRLIAWSRWISVDMECQRHHVRQVRIQNPQLWADDIAAIMKELRLERPILVGWSYGGFVICDYICAYWRRTSVGSYALVRRQPFICLQ